MSSHLLPSFLLLFAPKIESFHGYLFPFFFFFSSSTTILRQVPPTYDLHAGLRVDRAEARSLGDHLALVFPAGVQAHVLKQNLLVIGAPILKQNRPLIASIIIISPEGFSRGRPALSFEGSEIERFFSKTSSSPR